MHLFKFYVYVKRFNRRGANKLAFSEYKRAEQQYVHGILDYTCWLAECIHVVHHVADLRIAACCWALRCRVVHFQSRHVVLNQHHILDAHIVQLSVTLETEKSSLISNINTYGREKDESCLHFAAQSTRNVLTAERNVILFCCIFVSIQHMETSG